MTSYLTITTFFFSTIFGVLVLATILISLELMSTGGVALSQSYLVRPRVVY